MFNKKYLVVFIVLLVAMMTVSVAADVTNTNTKAKVTKDTSKVTNTQKIVKTTENTKKIKTNNKDNITSKKTNSKTKTEVKKTSKKNVKKDSDNKDFYVSDNDGSDNNQGTSDAPFKTLQKALDKTITGYTNNIYIKAGTYKGLGNTNLTVDGGKTINFIGDGVDETVFDGEAKYEYNTGDPDDPIFFWGSSDKWIFYKNESGNWFMNITDGRGQINLKNLTVTQMYSKGAYNERSGYYGDSINLYPTANIDNYGKLTVDNVLFDQNYGGVGSAIRNNNKATLTVNNSEFKKNQKSTSSGNEGIVYNNGTATILNSYFHDNYARWGTICNDKKITVINTTLERNEAYDGGSEFKYGAGIAYNTGGADFYNPYVINTDTTIINCTFNNVDQASVFGIFGNLTLTGNKFINTTGVKIRDDDRYYNNTHIIENNTFNGFIGSTLYKTLSNSELVYFGFDFEKTTNIIFRNNEFNIENGTVIKAQHGIIANNTINSQHDTSGIIVPQTGNITAVLIENNTLTANISINGQNDIVRNNKLIVPEEYGIIIGAQSRNETVTDNYIIALNKYGNDAVTPSSTSTIENNQPTLSNENLYVSPEVTEAQAGTPENPTTLMDALSKVNNGQSIIFLPGTTKVYNFTETINIKQDTVKEGTTNFKLVSLYDKTIFTNYNNLMFDIGAFNITLENITITKTTRNTQRAELIKTSANMTFINANISDNSYTTNNPLFSITNANITFINSTITGNKVAGIGATMANIVINKGTINFIDNCYIANNNKMTAFISGTSSTINIIGNNIFTDQTGVGSAGNNLTILGNNTFTNMKNIGAANYLLMNGTNKFYNSTDPNGNNILGANKYGLINGENIFENFGALFSSGTEYVINGSNIFNNTSTGNKFIEATKILINGSNIFINIKIRTTNPVIYSTGYLQIMGDNLFENMTVGRIIGHQNQLDTDQVVMNITGTRFINNHITNQQGRYIPSIFNLVGWYLSGNIISDNYFINNTFSDDASLIYIEQKDWSDYYDYYNVTVKNNLFENITLENGAIISNNEVEGCPSVVKIINNTFKNIQSNNETINLPKLVDTTITDNTYENCTIGLTDFTITSELEGQTIPQNTPIPITITAGLLHPEYYDANIMDKMTYYGYINDVNKNQSTSNVLTVEEAYTDENQGILNIYAKIAENTQSNTITVNLIKPLDTRIEITTPNENTVNKTTPITIIIKDENGQIIPGVEVTISTENKNETITLENGVIVYQYTPTTVGTETITVTYAGNSTLNPSNQTATLKVTVNKDEVIEELTNTTQEQEKTITKQENTIKEEQKKVETLNKTVETQKQNIEKLEEKVEKLTEKTKTQLTISKATATVGKKVTIKVTVKDANGKAVTGGKVSLKVNGKVLKDSNNNIIYADVNKGVASIKYLVPGSWIKQNPKIQAIYTGNDKYADSTVTKTKLLKVNKGSTNITLTPNIKSTKAGSKVTINVKHIDTNTKKGLTSKVAVKVNGKTYKVKVKNGEGVLTYTVPAGMNAKTVKVTASHSSKYYNKATSKTSFKVTKTTPTIKTTKTTYKSKKTTIKGKILDANNKMLTKNVKVTVKVDGKVVLKNKVVKKGKINLSFKKSLKKGYHELVITSKATKAFNKASFTGVLKV